MDSVRTPVFGNTAQEEAENLTILALVALVTCLWFGYKMYNQDWVQLQLAYFLNLIFGVQVKAGQIKAPVLKQTKKKKKAHSSRKKRPTSCNEDPSISVDTLSLLMSRFPKTSSFCSQTEECEEFMKEIQSKLEQPITQAGLAGAQTWLSCHVKWGPFGSDRGAWCDISDKLKKLRCTAASSFAKEIMQLSPEVQKNEVFVGQCQFLLKCSDPSESQMISRFFKDEGTTPSYFLVDNLMYHECIVKVGSSENRAVVWDFGIEYDAPNSSKAGLAIVAFKFDIDTPCKEVHFGNYTVPTNEWFTTCPEIKHPAITQIVKPYLSQQTNKKYVDLYGLRMDSKCENAQFTVFISGTAMNNGNPCPGVGMARCLRRSFGNRVKLVGFEYSIASGGIRDPAFDEVAVIKQFYGNKPFVKREVIKRVKRTLEENPRSYFISCFDVEIDLLVTAKRDFPDEEWTHRLLIPTEEVLESTEKPEISVIQKHFGMTAPEYCWVEEHNEEDVKQFFIAHGPSVLAKGVKFGCVPLKKAEQAKYARANFTKKWGMEVFLQKSIHGYERSYMFAAYKGKLLGAIEMRKDIVTAEGKCWGVHLEPLSAKTMADLDRMCKETKWTGGGEIEFMEDMAGNRYCTDFNPRFPAWVFGGCHGGINLPGLLLQEVTGIATDDVTSPSLGGDFIRSVIEVPVDNKLVQPVFMAGPDLSGCRGVVISKSSFSTMNLADNEVHATVSHPSRFGEIAQLSRCNECDSDEEVEEEESVDCITFPEEDIWVFDPTEFEKTPQFLFDQQTLQNTIDSINDFCSKIKIKTIVGLSVKTQPHSNVLQTAKKSGWYSECISQAEVQKSIDEGFPVNQIIVNGPLKNWPAKLPTEGLKAWFADSLEDFDQLIKTTPAEYVGFRLTPHNVASRFGVPIEKWREMKKRLEALPEGQKIGLHFHFAQTKIGSKSWFAMARSVVRMITMMCKTVELLDFGGGWLPGELVKHVEPMNELVDFARKRLPMVETVVFEPGKSVTQSAGGFVTEAKLFRDGCGQQRDTKKPGEFTGKGVVVDGFIGDLGVYGLHKHPMFYHSRIVPENQDVVVRRGRKSDMSFLASSVASSVEWNAPEDIKKLLRSDFFHFTKWHVAELNDQVIGCVFSFDTNNTTVDFEANNPLGEMVGDSILSDRDGLHLMCLHSTDSAAYSSLLHVLVKGSFQLEKNAVYLLEKSDKEFNKLGFFDETSEEEECSYKVLCKKHWRLVQPGKDQVLGRICMEFDQFGHITLPDDFKVGDHFLIRECGAYDMTMSYLFGDALQRDIVIV